jgi:hypothetical protein
MEMKYPHCRLCGTTFPTRRDEAICPDCREWNEKLHGIKVRDGQLQARGRSRKKLIV